MMCYFWEQNSPFVLNKIFLVQTIITFICLLALFIGQNLKKILQQIQSYEDASFLGPKWFICPKQNFFLKKIISFSSTYWPLSFCKILKKFLEPIQSYEDVPSSGPKYPNLSWTKFLVINYHDYFHLPIGPFSLG